MLNNDKTWFAYKNKTLLLELLAILNALSERFKSDTNKLKLINYIKGADISSLENVFLSPEGRQWISFTYRTLKDKESGDRYLSNYADWLGVDRSALLEHQIAKLDLFLVSLAAIANHGMDDPYEFELDHSGFFPGIDLYWKNTNSIRVKIDYEGVEFILEKDKRARLDIKDTALLKSLKLYKLPSSKMYPFSIDLNSEVARLNCQGREHLVRVDSNDYATINQQINVIEVALNYIKLYNSGLHGYFSEQKNYFVPLIGPEGSLPSSSNSSVDTMIWYSKTDHPLLLAEMIVHENSHQRLFRLQDVDPLIDRSKHNSGWDLCEIYSPWRDDPRPINGVFHGYVVFTEAARFWFSLIGKEDLGGDDIDICKRRMAMLVLQLRHAEASLSDCAFTSKGKEVFDFYSNVLNETLLPFVLKNDLGGLMPFFMEHHDQIELTGANIKTIVENHKVRWEAENAIK